MSSLNIALLTSCVFIGEYVLYKTNSLSFLRHKLIRIELYNQIHSFWMFIFKSMYFPFDEISCSFPGGSVIKSLPVNSGETGNASSILGSGRYPGEGNGIPTQYSCLEIPWT